MKVVLRLEPLVRLIGNLMSLNTWDYELMVSGGAYCLVVMYKGAKTYYRISEMTELGTDVLVCALPREFIVLLSTFGIKASVDAHLELILEEDDTINLSIEGYENTFHTQLEPWRGYFPEDMLEKPIVEYSNFSNMMNIYKFSSVENFVVEDGFVYGFEDKLEVVHMLPLNVSDDKVSLWFRHPKFMYSTLSKFKLENDTTTIYSSDTYGKTLYAVTQLKLASKEKLQVLVFYQREGVLFFDDMFSTIKNLHSRLLEAPLVNISSDKIHKQREYIEANELDNDALVLFAGNTKIKVKDFIRFFVKQQDALTEIRLIDTMVFVKGTVHSMFTLYEKVEADGTGIHNET